MSYARPVATTLAQSSSEPSAFSLNEPRAYTVWKHSSTSQLNSQPHAQYISNDYRGGKDYASPHASRDPKTRSPFSALKSAVMGRTRPRGESDLGRPVLQTRGLANSYAFLASSGSATPIDSPETPRGRSLSAIPESARSSGLPLEVLTAVLVSLPYLLSSLANNRSIYLDHSKHSSATEAAEDILEETASTALPVTTNISNLIQACALTSLTLLIVGLLGRMHLSVSPFAQRKGQRLTAKGVPEKPEDKLSLSSIRTILKRMLCVGLPYLATIELGGARTAIILLAAIAGGLLDKEPSAGEQPSPAPWRRALKTRKWTCALFLGSLVFDVLSRRQNILPSSIIRGYVALAKSTLFLQPPLPSPSLSPTQAAMMRRASTQAGSSPWQVPRDSSVYKRSHVSPLVASALDTKLTLAAGVILAAITTLLTIVLSSAMVVDPVSVVYSVASIGASVCLYCFSRPSSLNNNLKFGYGIGILGTMAFSMLALPGSLIWKALFSISCCLFYFALQLDTGVFAVKTKTTTENLEHSIHSHQHHQHSHGTPSRFTQVLLQLTSEIPLAHSILLNKESRRIVYFMSINLAFMFVQTFYALVAGSLGLLSDSIHMFFDCVGLLAGLVAAIMSKWPPNARFPYGYGKVETLSGLGNGIFLMIISVEIISESFERFVEGAELKRLDELLLVSIGGLVVNLVGLKFIGHAHHGHSHSHGHSHDHSHSHSNGNTVNGHAHSHSHALSDSSSSVHSHNQPSHEHGHGHDHGNENIAGIYLHILADTMGSVAVIVSTLLTRYTGWFFWDPLASGIIAVLIIAASYPLVVGSARKLLLTVPEEDEYALRNALQELSVLRGVASYTVPKFWTNDVGTETEHDHHDHDQDHQQSCSANVGQRIHGVIHVIADPKADLEDVRTRVRDFLKGRSVDIVAHVEKEGQGRCWCGGSGRSN